MAMFYAYCDESGHPSNPEGVVTVAAVVSDASGWCAFEDRWGRTLQEHEIATFHMTDYENCRGEFKQWTPHQRRHRLLIPDLSKTFTETLQFACVLSVAMEDWNAVMQVNYTDHRLHKVGPWLFLFLTCADAIYLTPRIPPTEKVAFWFEENRLLRAPAQEHFDKWKHTQGVADRLQSLTFSDKGSHLGFQAADLLAYEGRKHHLNQYVHGGSRGERKSHKALLRNDVVEERLFTRQGLRAYLLANHPPDAAPPR